MHSSPCPNLYTSTEVVCDKSGSFNSGRATRMRGSSTTTRHDRDTVTLRQRGFYNIPGGSKPKACPQCLNQLA